MRKILAITTLIFTMILLSTTAIADDSTNVVLGNRRVDFNRSDNGQPIGKPYVDNGRTYIPVRVISEDLGYEVDWLQATQTVVIEKESKKIELKIGESTALVNGVRKPIDVRDGKAVDTKALIKNGRTYVPVRFIAESLGEKVEWYNNTVLISSDMTLQEGMLILEGTIEHLSYNEVLELQGYSDPNPDYSDPNEEFIIFTLLKLQDITLPSSGGGKYIDTVQIISLDDINKAKKYDGKTIKISIDPNETFWPSDTSLPLGEPRSYSYKILEEIEATLDPYTWGDGVKERFEAVMVERGYVASPSELIYKEPHMRANNQGGYAVYIMYNGEEVHLVSVNVKTGDFHR